MVIHSERLAFAICLSFIFLFLVPGDVISNGKIKDKQRPVIDLAGDGWKAWLDSAARWEEDKERQFFKLYVDQPLTVGEQYVLEMKYKGPLKTDLVGLYLSTYTKINQTRLFD